LRTERNFVIVVSQVLGVVEEDVVDDDDDKSAEDVDAESAKAVDITRTSEAAVVVQVKKDERGKKAFMYTIKIYTASPFLRLVFALCSSAQASAY